MAFKKGQNPNHPRKGSSIRAEPIRNLNDIAKIKHSLASKKRYRDLCLFSLGINTAWRANELLSITVGQALFHQTAAPLTLKQSKTQSYRQTPINKEARSAIDQWLNDYEHRYPRRFRLDAPLFVSLRRPCLTVPTVSTLVKNICYEAGIFGNYSSHTLRKTWGYHQRVTFNSPLSLIMRAFGHTSERQTLAYIGILPQEVDDLYAMEL